MGIIFISLAMAASATPPAASSQATPAPRSGDDRVVCRRDDLVGTRLAPRVCMTRAQWRRQAEEARQNARGTMEETSRAGATPTVTPP